MDFRFLDLKANIRDLDNRVLGVVTDRYKVVQNEEAFSFTDSLLGEGLPMKRLVLFKKGAEHGFLQNCPKNILSVVMKLHHTLFL